MMDYISDLIRSRGRRISIGWLKAERKTSDIIQVKCIKDVTEQFIIKDEDIKNSW
jgi:hypothetical protein